MALPRDRRESDPGREQGCPVRESVRAAGHVDWEGNEAESREEVDIAGDEGGDVEGFAGDSSGNVEPV